MSRPPPNPQPVDPATAASLAGSPGANADPLSGETSSHPVGAGIGAASGGIAGAALGAALGPAGATLGSIVGAVAGGVAGKGLAEAVHPTAEELYWDHDRGPTTDLPADTKSPGGL